MDVMKNRISIDDLLRFVPRSIDNDHQVFLRELDLLTISCLRARIEEICFVVIKSGPKRFLREGNSSLESSVCDRLLN